MAQMLLPTSRYTAAGRRSPGAMAAAIAFNGGVIALLLAMPVAQVVIDRAKGPTTRWIELPPVPPKAEPEKKVEPKVTAAPRPSSIRDEKPVIPETILPTLGDGPDILGGHEHATRDAEFVQPTRPPEPARLPVLETARFDPRFAGDFKPDYPAAMRREDREGSVTLRVTIDEKGRVIAVDEVRASDPAFFEAARRHALRFWRFIPAKRDGQPVQSQQTMTLQFRLEA